MTMKIIARYVKRPSWVQNTSWFLFCNASKNTRFHSLICTSMYTAPRLSAMMAANSPRAFHCSVEVLK